jgi:hypothetical protein
MYLVAFATDYDGTLAHHGRVDEPTLAALERLKASGRKLLMVTGRELPDLQQVFDRLDLFDLVVAENGALLYFPETQEERLVGAPPPPALVEALTARGVSPLSVGRGIIGILHHRVGPWLRPVLMARPGAAPAVGVRMLVGHCRSPLVEESNPYGGDAVPRKKRPGR